jgi:hypothetical protein
MLPKGSTTEAVVKPESLSFDLLERMCQDRRWSRKRYGENLALLFRATFTGGEDEVVADG